MKVLNKILLIFLGVVAVVIEWISRLLGRRPPGPIPAGPRITAVDTPLTYPGSVITITGSGFESTLDGNSVIVGGQPARVFRASPTEIQAIISLAAAEGPITVTTGGITATHTEHFKPRHYPAKDSDEDGPPVYFEGVPNLHEGDAPSTGILKVLLVLVHPSDIVPANPANERADVLATWDTVHTFYDQASYGTLDVNVEATTGWTPLSENWAYYYDAPKENIAKRLLPQLNAEAANAAENDGKDLDNFDIMCVVLFLNGQSIRAWGGGSGQNFVYADLNIDVTVDHEIFTIAIHESANWGRFAHETGHCIVSSPFFPEDAIGHASIHIEDVYTSDLIDRSTATAHQFDLMGSHDEHPLYSGYYMEQMGYYSGADIVELQWNRNAFSQTYDIVAHGMARNAVLGRCHLVKIKVTEGLYYYIECRQRPGATAQIFDENIPIGASTHEGGVIVTRVLTDTMYNNQQTRFITLLHEPVVLTEGEVAVDPARDLTITVMDEDVADRPLVSRVQVAWAQRIEDDPNGAFDLWIEPWNSNCETPDIWVDRPPENTFDYAMDSEGRPTGNGDMPQPMAINKFVARVHNSGDADITDVRVTFYSVSPPGVGDNGNWAPVEPTVTVGQINHNDYFDAFVNWVPAVGEHTCLKAFVSQQLGETTGGNNWAQENVFDFTAPANSPPEPLVIQLAVRNPRDERSLVYVVVKNVPYGYIVQFPHQWLMMDALEERKLNLVVIPRLDIGVYERAGEIPEGQQKEIRRRADVKVMGYLPREYVDEMTMGSIVASRIVYIGGVLARITPKRKGSIELGEDQKYPSDSPFLGLIGHVSPVRAGEKVSVFLTDPSGCRWVLQRITDASGTFRAVFDVTYEPSLATLPWQNTESGVPREPAYKYGPFSGRYKAQAILVNSPNVAETESAVIDVVKVF